VYLWKAGDQAKPIRLRVGTIASVKGQTHDATLVLETNEGTKMSVAAALQAAFGAQCGKPGKSVTKALTNVFVGATRPRHALGLAALRESVDGGLAERIRAAGWVIHDLTCAARH
jgi:hypothetical protein